jgi:TFIIF-interacting CTD phosphatase-like protein
MILVLDIDETLVHSSTDSLYGGEFKVGSYTVKTRPHLDKFIQYITNNPYYQAGVWSAGVTKYVNTIVEHIFPDPSILLFVEARDFCNANMDKPLSKIRELVNKRYDTSLTRSEFVIIDDRENVTKFDELNHIQIPKFMGDEKDDYLLQLIEFLDINKGSTSECLVVNW